MEPTYLNQSQLARELKASDEAVKKALQRGIILADATDLLGRKLFLLENLPQIQKAIGTKTVVEFNTPEILA